MLIGPPTSGSEAEQRFLHTTLVNSKIQLKDPLLELQHLGMYLTCDCTPGENSEIRDREQSITKLDLAEKHNATISSLISFI